MWQNTNRAPLSLLRLHNSRHSFRVRSAVVSNDCVMGVVGSFIVCIYVFMRRR